MRLTIVNDYEELSCVSAELIISLLQEKPDAVITLPAGGTPIGMYSRLVDAYRKGRVDFSRMRLFDIDTVYAPRSDPHTHYSYIREHFSSKTNLNPDNWFYLDPMPDDAERFAQEYEDKIRDVGGIDLVIDGLGHNGHLGYNEPGSEFSSRTRMVVIHEKTRKANARWYSSLEEVPKTGITMGIATIMEARRIVILVSGKDKAEIVRRVVEGPITEEVPMTVIRTHRNSAMIVDKAAARMLSPLTLRKVRLGEEFN
ncbi:MAG: glucosamine-6-phosphate deaminase [Candidatus Fermentithermobacillus carboniphilus]|uniref:Glucosamine-6-phosphate deaminase n=1 Tax=Candidatus Fermentithermobacillus carboniphilus TaxID=3085328 RepID=A0AAT9LFC0_9FIRM|nr:MAG: glucosamine-6-phosphate deaminase [Candidatus Fermentithermobacillus carboniphilus]